MQRHKSTRVLVVLLLLQLHLQRLAVQQYVTHRYLCTTQKVIAVQRTIVLIPCLNRHHLVIVRQQKVKRLLQRPHRIQTVLLHRRRLLCRCTDRQLHIHIGHVATRQPLALHLEPTTTYHTDTRHSDRSSMEQTQVGTRIQLHCQSVWQHQHTTQHRLNHTLDGTLNHTKVSDTGETRKVQRQGGWVQKCHLEGSHNRRTVQQWLHQHTHTALETN